LGEKVLAALDGIANLANDVYCTPVCTLHEATAHRNKPVR
jgi:hypothetical protein